MFRKIILLITAFVIVNSACADSNGIVIHNHTNQPILFGYNAQDNTKIANANQDGILTWSQIDNLCNGLVGCEIGLSATDSMYLGWFAVDPRKNIVTSPFYPSGDTDKIEANFPTDITIIDLHK